MIPEKLLLQNGGRIIEMVADQMVFKQQEYARNFYQIKTGQVQLSTINEEGKEFIQGIFEAGESFGEPPIFANFTYPANAIILTDTELIVIPKENFMDLLKSHPKYYLVLLNRLSTRLHYKATISQVISNEHAESRILTLIDYMKKKEGIGKEIEYQVPLTRQQVGDLIGLRVETVIRTISNLKNKNQVKIKGGKIFR